VKRSFRTLKEELTKLIQLKNQSLIRGVAVHEENKKQIAEIFERINQAREQLVVRIFYYHFLVYISLLLQLFSWLPVSESIRQYMPFKKASRYVSRRI